MAHFRSINLPISDDLAFGLCLPVITPFFVGLLKWLIRSLSSAGINKRHFCQSSSLGLQSSKLKIQRTSVAVSLLELSSMITRKHTEPQCPNDLYSAQLQTTLIKFVGFGSLPNPPKLVFLSLTNMAARCTFCNNSIIMNEVEENGMNRSICYSRG